MARRYYSNTAVATTITGAVGTGDTSITLDDATGWPTSTPFNVVLERGTSKEEVVQCTTKAGSVLTITRGHDGTTAVAHGVGATAELGIVAEDLDLIHTHFHDGVEGYENVLAVKNSTGAGGTITGTTDSELLGVDFTIPTDWSGGYDVYGLCQLSYEFEYTNTSIVDVFFSLEFDGAKEEDIQLAAGVNIGVTPVAVYMPLTIVLFDQTNVGTGTRRLSLQGRKSSGSPDVSWRDATLFGWAKRVA